MLLKCFDGVHCIAREISVYMCTGCAGRVLIIIANKFIYTKKAPTDYIWQSTRTKKKTNEREEGVFVVRCVSCDARLPTLRICTRDARRMLLFGSRAVSEQLHERKTKKKQSTPSREYMYIQDCECALESQIHICDKTQFAVQASAQSGGGVARKVCYALFLNENRCIVYVYAVLWRTLVVQRQSNFVQGKRLNPAA